MRLPLTSTASRLRLALALTAIVLVVEIAGGLWAHSLALLSDAGHVLGGVMAAAAVVGLGISLLIARALKPMAADLSVRSALIHIRGDAWASAGIIVAGFVILVG